MLVDEEEFLVLHLLAAAAPLDAVPAFEKEPKLYHHSREMKYEHSKRVFMYYLVLSRTETRKRKTNRM